MNHNSLLMEGGGDGRRGRERERRGWTNLLTLELIEQNESCTAMKRDCKAEGKGSLTRGGYTEVRRTGGKQRHMEAKWGRHKCGRGGNIKGQMN